MLGRVIGGLALSCLMTTPSLAEPPPQRPYSIVDTNQRQCYDDQGRSGCDSSHAGQDAAYRGHPPHYRDNGNGTISDLVTGLMWQKNFSRTSWADAPAQAAAARTGGYGDWRVPSIKELYSLIDFSGSTGRARPEQQGAPADARPYLDTRVFDFEYPHEGRFIDAQYVSRTAYLGMVMGRDQAFFGVNFADGRIKGYPQDGGRGRRSWYGRYVRGNPAYGRNDFHDNGDATITDRATGLTWTKADSGHGLNWTQALGWCEGLHLADRDDWRLPDAKELHSIVDYDRSPSVTHSAAIDPIFTITAITAEDGRADWPFFWTSTSHLDGRRPGDFAVYIAFGRAFGYLGQPPRPRSRQDQATMMMDAMGGSFGGPPAGMDFGGRPGHSGMAPPGLDGNAPIPPGGPIGRENAGAQILTDVHGAGAQRSSPKSGDQSRLPKGAGPQGDVLRIENFARCVRG